MSENKLTHCPYCNCSGGFIHEESPEGKKVKGKVFCFECFKFVKLVKPGTLWKNVVPKYQNVVDKKEEKR